MKTKVRRLVIVLVVVALSLYLILKDERKRFCLKETKMEHKETF